LQTAPPAAESARNILELDASQLTPEILDKLAEHLIRKESGSLAPAEMEMVKKQLAARRPVDTSFERASRTTKVSKYDTHKF